MGKTMVSGTVKPVTFCNCGKHERHFGVPLAERDVEKDEIICDCGERFASRSGYSIHFMTHHTEKCECGGRWYDSRKPIAKVLPTAK